MPTHVRTCASAISLQSIRVSGGGRSRFYPRSIPPKQFRSASIGFRDTPVLCRLTSRFCLSHSISSTLPRLSAVSSSPSRACYTDSKSPSKQPNLSSTLFSSPPVATSLGESDEVDSGHLSEPKSKWRKPMCLYFTQGLCTYMDDPEHLKMFNHTYPSLSSSRNLRKACRQPFSYFLVLDLEGMVEILEFPIVMLNSETLEVVDRFHRFVRPAKMSEKKIGDYIKGKYGRWGLERVWHDTAIPFTQTLKQFEAWLETHNLWDSKGAIELKDAAFVTCGNWDVKTKIPQQCVTSGIELPTYFMEWINLKDVYLNFYKRRASGMLAMLKGLDMQMLGTHHIGLDDAHNIARILHCMLSHGAIMKITARRPQGNPLGVQFRYKKRIR